MASGLANLQETIKRLAEGAAELKKQLERRRPEVLEICGYTILSYAQQDYQTKSRGGRGTDGIAWKPNAPSTIARKARKGRANERRTHTVVTTPGGERTKKKGKLRPVGARTAIGVDTGLQRASAQPGARSNVFSISPGDASVTVGYGRAYSEYFDQVRPLLPNQLPDLWERELDAQLEAWATGIAETYFKLHDHT